MTKKIYYDNAYLKEWKSEIIEIQEENEKYYAILDSTIFYPEGGGQPGDTGTINGIRVLDVKEKNDIIYHQMAAPVAVGPADLAIDWERRYDFMQQHTGEHLLSGIILKEYGGNNKSFHMGADFVTIDIDIKSMSNEMLDHVESLVNQAIYKGIQLEQIHTDKDNLSLHNPRKDITAQGSIRVVKIPGYDVCACCGTHVDNIAQVGILKILKTEAYKGMTRISFVAGERAYKDYVQRFEIIRELKMQLQSDENSIIHHVQRLKNELSEMKFQLQEEKQRLANRIAEEWLAEEYMAEEKSSIYRVYEDLDKEHLGKIMEKIKDKADTAVLGSGKDNRLIAYSKTLDIGKLLKEEIKQYHGKGGGRGGYGEASFTNPQDLASFVVYLKSMGGNVDEKL